MYERWDHMDEFEDFLQENADMHKLYPSDKVWRGIQHQLQPKPKWTYLFVAVVFLSLGVAGTLFDSSFSQKDLPKQFTLLKSFSPELTQENIQIEKTNSTIEKAVSLKQENVAEYSEDEIILSKLQTISSNAASSRDITLEKAIVAPEVIHSEVALKEEEIAEGTLSIASVNKINTKKYISLETFTPNSISKELKKLPKSNALKFGWQFYLSPTTSYRKLSGKGLPYYTNAGNNMSSVFARNNVENSVTHKPSLGFEMGGAITYAATKNIRLKLGLQFNVNRYEVQAFHSVPEVAPMTSGTGSGSINVVSTYRNYSGFSKTWLKNQHILMSFPLGAEWTLFGNDKIQFNIAGTLQPTIVVNNQAYMISANMANYAKAPSLYKEFNMAAGAEAFLSIKGKSLRYNVGPQFRYQLFSSYKKPYPISEHLTDYGIKLSIGR